MTFVQALQLLLLLLPLPLLRSSPCPSTVKEMVVTTTSDAKTLAEALLCDGSASFTVTWYGDVTLSHTLFVSNGSTLNVAGSSGNTDADTGAVVTSDGTLLLFEVDHRSTVSLTGLTLYGGDGALRVNGDSFVEAVDCTFKNSNRTSSNLGGAIFVNGSTVVLKGETVFANNTADAGGAIYLTESSELNITKGGSVYFLNNHAAVNGGAVRLYNQSVLNSYGTASFTSNEAEYGGGAIGLSAQSVVNSYGTASFVSNEAEFGGAMVFFDSKVNFIGSVSFEGNYANISGGAVYADDDSYVLFGDKAVSTNNTATYGGAMLFDDSSKGDFIGIVSFESNHAFYSGGKGKSEDATSTMRGTGTKIAALFSAYFFTTPIYLFASSSCDVLQGKKYG